MKVASTVTESSRNHLHLSVCSHQISACTCPCFTGTVWWGRWPSPVQKAAISPHAPQMRSTTRRPEVWRWCPCLWTASRPRGGPMTAPQVPCPHWREACSCGWAPTAFTLAGCATAECTGNEDRPSMQTNPTSWRGRPAINSCTHRTVWQVRCSVVDLQTHTTCTGAPQIFFWNIDEMAF